MQSKPEYLKSLSLAALTVILTAVTGVMGAVPLRLSRNSLDRRRFVMSGIGLSVGFYYLKMEVYALLILSLFVLVGTFKEFENRNFHIFKSGLSSVLISSAVFVISFFTWAQIHQIVWRTWLQEKADLVIAQLGALGGDKAIKVTASDLVAQVPSAIVIFMLIGLALSLIMDKQRKLNQPLIHFKIPNVFVWGFIASAFAANSIRTAPYSSLQGK